MSATTLGRSETMGVWIFGAVMGLLSFLGLFIASRAHDAPLYWAGLAFFAFGVLFIFGLIARHTGKPHKNEH